MSRCFFKKPTLFKKARGALVALRHPRASARGEYALFKKEVALPHAQTRGKSSAFFKKRRRA
jgi:hypothetical protein